MAMKTMVNITLEKIIQRKILYCQKDNNQELANMNAGYVRGFNQMLEDMNLTETEFITKYLNIVKELKVVFDGVIDQKESIENIDELSGYHNAIVDILGLLNEKYLYYENW